MVSVIITSCIVVDDEGVARRAVPNTPKSSPDTLAGNRTEASAVSRPYDKFNDNYPLSSPDQKRTEVRARGQT
eukprot:5071249-Amphidinium_carterae.3